MEAKKTKKKQRNYYFSKVLTFKIQPDAKLIYLN